MIYREKIKTKVENTSFNEVSQPLLRLTDREIKLLS